MVDKCAVLDGAPAGARTPDTRLKRAVLYLLSYWGKYENRLRGLFFNLPGYCRMLYIKP